MSTKFDFKNFCGTEGYHYLNFMKNLKFTDGMAYLAEEGKCYWLMDIVASVQNIPKIIENNNFLIWRLEKNGEGATITAYTDSERGGGYSDTKKVYEQEIPYSDFEFERIPEGRVLEFFQCGDVCMLKGEY